MMHVVDVVLYSFSNHFRSHRYSPLEEIYSVDLFIAGLSLMDLSERVSLTGESRESVKIWVHRFLSLFKPSKRARRLVAVDETDLKVKGQMCILRKVLDSREGKPVVLE
jgi:transposase-like protein